MQKNKFRFLIILLSITAILGFVLGCENPLHSIIASDVAPKYPSILIRHNIDEIGNGTGLFNFGNVQVGESLTVDFVIENKGDGELTLKDDFLVSITGTNANEFSVTQMPSAKIAPGYTTEFSMEFRPRDEGGKIAQVQIACDDSENEAYVFTVTGMGTAVPLPEIKITQSSDEIVNGGNFDFGSTQVDIGKSFSFEIANTGEGDLWLTGSPEKVQISGTDAGDFSVTLNPSSPVISGGSQSFTLELYSSLSGTKSASVKIENNDPDESSFSFDLIANVTDNPEPEINVKQGGTNILDGTGSYTFADTALNGTRDIVFTVENLGTAGLTLTGGQSVAIGGINADQFTVTLQPNSLIDAGTDSDFTIQFHPTSLGNKTATVTIANTDTDEGTYNFTISGTVVAPEMNIKQDTDSIASPGGSYPFAATTVADYTDAVFTIENTGTDALLLEGTPRVVISGTNADQFAVAVQPPAASVDPDGNTAFTIRFEPASGGTKNATITIDNNDADEDPYTFSISGDGLEGEMDLFDETMTALPDGTGSFVFADTLINTYVDTVITIENNGLGNLYLYGTPKASISGAGADSFSVITQPSSTVGPSGDTSLTIRFQPVTAGDKTATVSLSSNDLDENPYTFSIEGVSYWSGIQYVDDDTEGYVGQYNSTAAVGDEVYMVYSFFNSPDSAVKFAKSSDGGATWPVMRTIDTYSGVGSIGVFCSIAVSGSNVYVCHQEYLGGPGAIGFAKSTDGGDTWPSENIVQVAYDHDGLRFPSMAVSGSNVYICYLRESGNELKVARSVDDGETWDPEDILTVDLYDGGQNQSCIAASGSEVYLSYIKSGNLTFAKSEDYGATWPVENIIMVDESSNDSHEAPSLAVSGTDIFISYCDSDLYRLLFTKSSDSGDTWPLGNRKEADNIGGNIFKNSIAVSGSNVYISYSADSNESLKFTCSSDSGVTWPSGNRVTVESVYGSGGYNGIAVSGSSIYIGYYIGDYENTLKIAKSVDGGVTW